MHEISIFDIWDNYHNSKTFKPENLRKETSRYQRHVLPYWKDKDFTTLKLKDVINYRSHLSKSDLSPQTIKHCLSLLRRILNRAIQLELYIGEVPHFEMPTVDNRRIRFLTENEANQLLTALFYRSELWHDISLFALFTGMRASEIFALTPFSVNLIQRSITILSTKNSHTRVIPLNEISYKIIEKYQVKELPYLFTEKQIKQVSRIFRTTVSELNLNRHITDRRERIVFHSLRHTFASWLVQKGVQLIVISNLLGHKGLQMTMRYAHLAPEQGQYAVNLLPNNISSHIKST